MLIDESIKTAGIYIAEEGDMPQVRPGCYGHLVSRGDRGELVGSIGCAVDVVMATPAQSPGLNCEKEMDDMIGAATKGDFSAKDRDSVGEDGTSKGEEESLVVLVRGSFRFVVREVIKTIPYIVAVVDELRDDEPGAVKNAEEVVAQVEEVADSIDSNAPSEGIFYNDFEDFGGDFVQDEKSTDTEATISSETDEEEEEEDDDEDDDDIYSDLSTQELVQRSMAAMKAIVDQKLQSATTSGMTPLEMSILEDAGMPIPNRDAQRSQAEEYGAVLEIFRSELIDICQTPKDIYYAVGMLTAEMADANNEMRTKCLTTTDGVERLRMTLRLAEDRINKVAAQRLTEQITEEVSADEKYLKVGKAVIPQWAYQIKKGTRVSYFWNEIEGWCKGYVAEDPVKIGDELIIAVTFDDDGSTHKLPFLAEEKVRWRPGDMDD